MQALADNVSEKESKKQVNKYLSSMAAKGRITRLEELKAKSYIAAKQAASVELDKSTGLYTKAIQDAFDQVNADGLLDNFNKDVELSKQTTGANKPSRHIITDPKTGKEITVVNTQPDPAINGFKELSGKYVKAALDTPWYGRNFSQRIWHNTDKLAERVNELFTAQQMSGMRERDMAKALADEFGAGMARAKTLIRTEANYFHNKTNLDSWKQRGVKQYKLVAVLDMRTSKFCRDIDGEVIDVSRAVMGLTFPPFHPNCRTVAVIYLPNSPYKLKRTANDPISGGTIKLDADATYHDWEQAIIAKHGEDAVGLNQLKAKNYRADFEQYRNYQEVLGNANSPKSFDDFQMMKYNRVDEYRELINIVREVNWERSALDNVHIKSTDHNVPYKQVPNSVYDRYIEDKLISRRYYGKTGKARLDIDFTNHGNNKMHTIVPHAHSWLSTTTKNGKTVPRRERPGRELSKAERIVNDDVKRHKN